MKFKYEGLNAMQSYQKIQSAIRFKFYTLSFDDDEVPSTNLKYFVPGQTLKDAKLLPQYQKVRMLGIHFAPQGAELAQKQILPRIQEFYYRSMVFFFWFVPQRVFW